MSVRIGLIGTGNISGAHITALKQVGDAQIVAVCDVDPARAASRAADAGAGEVFTDYQKMLDGVKLDAVWLCTPPTVRSGPIEASIERDIPVFTEKPVAGDLATAQAVAEKIERSGVPVIVGYQLRYMEIVDRVRTQIADDRISLVCSTYCCPLTLDYQAGRAETKWLYQKNISGGAIVDQATHSFDLMRYFIGEITSMNSIGSNYLQPKTQDHTVEDTYSVAFRFENGAAGVHGHTWCHHAWRFMLQLYGLRGAYTLMGSHQRAEWELAGGEKTVCELKDDPMLNQDRHIVEMIESGNFSQIRSSYADAVKTLALTKRCLEVMELPGESGA